MSECVHTWLTGLHYYTSQHQFWTYTKSKVTEAKHTVLAVLIHKTLRSGVIAINVCLPPPRLQVSKWVELPPYTSVDNIIPTVTCNAIVGMALRMAQVVTMLKGKGMYILTLSTARYYIVTSWFHVRLSICLYVCHRLLGMSNYHKQGSSVDDKTVGGTCMHHLAPVLDYGRSGAHFWPAGMLASPSGKS